MSTFISIPADRLLKTLEEIGQKIAEKGGRIEVISKKGSETIVEIALPPNEKTMTEFIVLKVYTSCVPGSSEARGNGEDAIRIAVGSISTGEFKPVRQTTTIKRTSSERRRGSSGRLSGAPNRCPSRRIQVRTVCAPLLLRTPHGAAADPHRSL